MFKPHLLYYPSNLYLSIVMTDGGRDNACLEKEGENSFWERKLYIINSLFII